MNDPLRAITMSRAEWSKDTSFDARAAVLDVTVLMSQSHSKRLTQLALESLLRFYPDIPILVVDNLGREDVAYQDDSSLYLDWIAINHSNIMVWRRTGINSHGVTMDEAIKNHIDTKYVLLFDSDTLTERGGFIEGMLSEFDKQPDLYAIGAYMPMSLENDGCGGPHNENDVLHYAHPQCSIYRRDTYLTLPPFTDHGAPCCYNCEGAQGRGLLVRSWPIDLYVSHLAGASWTTPRTIWQHDHGVYLRPFVTFIIDDPGIVVQLQAQTDQDFDVVSPLPMGEAFFCVVPIQGEATPRHVQNDIYPLRYRVTGEYICRISGSVFPGFVDAVKCEAVATRGANEINVGGAMCYRRNYWQRVICLNT